MCQCDPDNRWLSSIFKPYLVLKCFCNACRKPASSRSLQVWQKRIHSFLHFSSCPPFSSCLDPLCVSSPTLIDKYSCWPFHYWMDGTEKMDWTVVQWKHHLKICYCRPSVTFSALPLFPVSAAAWLHHTWDFVSLWLWPRFYRCKVVCCQRTPYPTWWAELCVMYAMHEQQDYNMSLCQPWIWFLMT